MNGRVYDPAIGRFLSVDPIFQFPTNTQSLNPYTYALNNPLSLVDPNGYASACPGGPASSQSSCAGRSEEDAKKAAGKDGRLYKGHNGQTQTGSHTRTADTGASCGGCHFENKGNGWLAVQDTKGKSNSSTAGATNQGAETQKLATTNVGDRGNSPVTADPGADAAQDWADAAAKADNPVVADTDNFMGGVAVLGSNAYIVETASTLATAGLLEALVKFGGKLDSLYEGEDNSNDGSLPRGGTYVLRDSDGRVVRSGRSNDLDRRRIEHARDPNLRDYRFEPVHRTDDSNERRGLEQLLHDKYNPPLNKIRPISPSNPKLPEYQDAAKKFLDGGSP